MRNLALIILNVWFTPLFNHPVLLISCCWPSVLFISHLILCMDAFFPHPFDFWLLVLGYPFYPPLPVGSEAVCWATAPAFYSSTGSESQCRATLPPAWMNVFCPLWEPSLLWLPALLCPITWTPSIALLTTPLVCQVGSLPYSARAVAPHTRPPSHADCSPLSYLDSETVCQAFPPSRTLFSHHQNGYCCHSAWCLLSLYSFNGYWTELFRS